MNPALVALYVVTDPVLPGDRPLVQVCREALDAGVKILQLRDKQADTRRLLEQAIELKALAAAHGALLLVNDRVDVALAGGADGVHLGQDDLPLAAARRLLGPRAVVGVSVRTPAQARQAEAGGADYLAANGVFPTPTKPELEAPLGIAGVRALRAASRLPLVAIGGIHDGNAVEVVAAGADGVAVVSAVMAAADPKSACRRLLAAVAAGRKHRV